MTKEEMNELSLKFKEAYARRFGKDDIDWKPTRYKDKATGQWKDGPKLAYLNWAVAWRAMKEVYPDANYRLIETPDGNPLWNVNGYGMLKCAVSAMGIEHVETFPIMTGGANEAMPIVQGDNRLDCRDVNDSAQRGLTKACARFGIGLYIYEGKLESPKDVVDHPVNYEPLKKPNFKEPDMTPANTDEGPIIKPRSDVALLTDAQLKCIDKLVTEKGVTDTFIKQKTGISTNQRGAISKGDATKVIKFLISLPAKPKEAPTEVVPEDDLPF